MPVRLKDIEERKCVLFKAKNEALLKNLCPLFRGDLPIYINMTRLQQFALLDTIAKNYSYNVWMTLKELRFREDNSENAFNLINPDNALMNSLLSDYLAEERVDEDHETKIKIKHEIFPEQVIEVFDEVTDADITPTWAYDISLIESRIRATITSITEIQTLEEILAQKTAIAIKEKGRADRKAAKEEARAKARAEAKRAREIEIAEMSDYDSAEEEEEEEEEEEGK